MGISDLYYVLCNSIKIYILLYLARKYREIFFSLIVILASKSFINAVIDHIINWTRKDIEIMTW